MAKKNFSSMSTKKLNLLLETANDEDKALIQAVLDKRAGVAAPAEDHEVGGNNNPDVVVEPLTESEQKALDEAEANEKAAKKTTKMTDDECHALAEELRATALNHRCEVVPFNTIEWVPGTIVGIIEEKRTNKVMYAVRTDDGRRVVKAYGTNLLRVLNETVEPVKRGRVSTKATKLDENGNPITPTVEPWTDEEIEEAVKAVIDNVGKAISYPKTGALGVEIEGETETGRIVSLVPNKRQKTMLYRIEINQPEGVKEKKYAHKVVTNDSLVIADALDEVGAKINEVFKNRRYKEVVNTASLTPEEAFKVAEASLNKAKEQLERQKAVFVKREEAYYKAKEAYEAALTDNTHETTEPAESTDELA